MGDSGKWRVTANEYEFFLGVKNVVKSESSDHYTSL